jgi:hypothetical protein
MITLSIKTKHNNNTKHNNTQHKDTKHNNTQHKDTKHYNTQNKDTKLNNSQHNNMTSSMSEIDFWAIPVPFKRTVRIFKNLFTF